MKQFIATTVRNEVRTSISELETKMNAGFAGVGDAIETLGKHLDEQTNTQDVRIDDHEQRITHLEQKTA